MLYLPRFRAKHITFCLNKKNYYSTPAGSGSGSSSNIDPKLLNYTKLINRSLIRLKGTDVDTFLQGLVTNDVKAHFKSRSHDSNYSIMYSFMLNTQGRVLYDLLMYAHFNNGGEVLLECDRDLQNEVVKTLKTYRLRKKLDIDLLDHELQTFCVYFDDVEKYDSKSIKIYLQNLHKNELGSIFCSDPRIPNLGCRVVLRNDLKLDQIFAKIDEKPIDNYQRRRYALGIGEGSGDLPVGNCFPLESNGDYLNGVSFHKGCYVGQELTARTHHTGVVRKRLMPLFFNESIKDRVKPGAKILDDQRQENVGKFRSGWDNVGLALLRVEEVLKANELHVLTSDAQKLTCKTKKPDWWLNNSAMVGEVHVNAQPAKA